MPESITTLAQAGAPASSDQLLTPSSPAATGTTGTPAGGGGQPATSPFGGMLPFLLIFVLIMFLMPFLANRKEKKKRATLLDGLRKGDKVLTIGGMLGTVAEVRDDEVVLKIDENANFKARFTKSSIQQVLSSIGGPADQASGGAGGASGSGSGNGGGASVEVKGRHERAAAR